MLATPAADLKRTLIYDEHVAAGTKFMGISPHTLYRHAFVIEAVSTITYLYTTMNMR